jgi:thiamine-phosphate pyrophosphorylase
MTSRVGWRTSARPPGRDLHRQRPRRCGPRRRRRGTHLGAEDLPIAAIRRVAGPGHLIGGTARDPERAAALVAAGVDYLGVGPGYRTVTKSGLPDPRGPRVIGTVAHAVDVPVIAIGGVTAQHVPELCGAGAHGIAVVTAISEAPDPAEATRTLLRTLDGSA